MTWLSESLGFDLAWVFVWGAALTSIYFAVFWILEVLPWGDDRRAHLARVRPLAGVVLALVFFLFSAHTLFSRYEQVLPIALLLVIVAFFIGCRSLIRDFFSGVALRAEQSFRVGDQIRVADTVGRVVELGPRSIRLETPEGDSALIPYSRAAQQPIIRTRATESHASRTFTLEASDEISFAILGRTVKQAALLHHWGSIARPPEVTAKGAGQIEITIFALASAHAADVELAVRKALERDHML